MMFARTGRILNAPYGYLNDLSVTERIKILEECKYNDIFRLVDPAALSLSEAVKVYSLSSKTVVIIVRNNRQVICCRIDESLLVDGINAFLSSLDKSGFLLDEERRSAAIDMCIEAAKTAAV